MKMKLIVLGVSMALSTGAYAGGSVFGHGGNHAGATSKSSARSTAVAGAFAGSNSRSVVQGVSGTGYGGHSTAYGSGGQGGGGGSASNNTTVDASRDNDPGYRFPPSMGTSVAPPTAPWQAHNAIAISTPWGGPSITYSKTVDEAFAYTMVQAGTPEQRALANEILTGSLRKRAEQYRASPSRQSSGFGY